MENLHTIFSTATIWILFLHVFSIGSVTEAANSHRTTDRRLLMVPEAKKEALNGLEDVLLEPPRARTHQLRTRYFPDLMGDTLDGYPRRVFVDVGGEGEGWFEEHYPTRNREFEMIRVETKEGEGEGMPEWLERNVKEEDYVVMRAEAEVVEGLAMSRAIGLVDELFLQCRHRWEKGRRSRRAYWECLALYGKLRDEGVAVHQWWG